jgi:phage gp29-like protein
MAKAAKIRNAATPNPFFTSQAGTPKPAAHAPNVSGGGKSPAEMVRKSNMWRDNYNPLRQLTIARLIAIFEQAERGAYPELQLILRKAEKRFPILKGFIEKLTSSIEELNWDVKVMDPLPDGVQPGQAEAQRKFLKGRYDLLKGLSNTFGQIALAEIRGYAVLQKHRYQDGGPNDGAVQELYWIEPWCWSREGYYGDFYYNENSRFGIGLGTCQATLGEDNRVGSDDLPREDFVIREVDSPIYEIALIAFVNWLMSRKDWSAFVEIFGLPNSIVIMPPGIPQGKEAEYQASAEKVADGISGALPNGSDVKFPTAGARNESPFIPYCDAQEKDVVLAGTGGELTMLSRPTGIGKGASEEHDAAWQKIASLKARRINETLQRDFDIPELAAEFPGQPVAVYFELAVHDEENISELADTVVKFEGVNLQTDVAEISERSGLKLTRVTPPDPAQPDPAEKADQGIDKKELGAAVRNRDDVPAVAAATAKDLQPVLKAIDEGSQRIFSITDPQLRLQKWRELWASTQQIRQDAAQYPAAALVLQKLNAEAAARGLKGEEPVQNRILNDGSDQPRDSLGKWVDENGGGLSEKDNLQRGQKAINRAMQQKTDVQKAMHRKEVGQIDFKWGRPGTSNPDAGGRTHTDGYGISHIIAKHGEDTARQMPEVLAKGKISPHENEQRRYVTHGGYRAVLERQNSKQAFVVTGFEEAK